VTEQDSREGAMAVWDDGLAAFTRTLGEVHTECDSKCIQAEAIQQDCFAQTRSSGQPGMVAGRPAHVAIAPLLCPKGVVVVLKR
jgi:hypothetical protein